MPIVHELPPESFIRARKWRAHQFDPDCLKRWRKMSPEWWLYRGKLVDPAHVAAFGVHDAWVMAQTPACYIDARVDPPIIQGWEPL